MDIYMVVDSVVPPVAELGIINLDDTFQVVQLSLQHK